MGAHADTVRDNEWALSALQAREAWTITRGEGVTVAVLDTGVDPNHPDLSGSVITGPDLIGGGRQLGDPYWGQHGTAMASAIAGHGHGPGNSDGVIGIAPAAKILSIRVTLENDDPARGSGGRGTTISGPLEQGIRYAADHGAQVISMSLGETFAASNRNSMEDEAVQYAIAHGVVVVASAGNNAQTSNLTSFPAAYPGVIAVGATDQGGHRAVFSTREWDTSVAAPGVNVMGARPGGSYRAGDGTSPAAAFVAGVCALIRARYPKLSPAQVREVLEHSAAGQPSGTYTAELGWGEVQPAAALKLAASLQPQPADPRAAAYRARYFGDGRVPAVGVGAAPRPLYLGFLIPAGGAILVCAVLLATLRRRRRTML
jgi:type VII secretion-associated serine protease mycosin